MKYAVKTDRGLVREKNEDCCSVITGYSGVPDVFVIADGMGGHNSGEIASKTAVDYINNAILDKPGIFSAGADVKSVLKMLIHETNMAVYNKSIEYKDNHGMGTTLTAAVISDGMMYIGHVGDSRLYLLRDGSISRVTTDHSYIEELVRNGSLTREEAVKHPGKNIITRALGCSEELDVDMYSLAVRNNDCYVLCTDGLTNMVDEDEITKVVSCSAPEAACEELVDLANKNGGEDNITIIVIKNE